MTESSDDYEANADVYKFTVRMLGMPFPVVFALEGADVHDLPGGDGRAHGSAHVTARADDSLATVLDRAAVRLGLSHLHVGPVSSAIAWLRFYGAEDDEFSYGSLLWANQMSVIDARGLLRVDRRLDQVLVSDLERTAEAGLIDGDPFQPYLIPTIPQGGLEPWGLDWPTLIGHLQTFWTALGAATTVDGTVTLAQRLRRRLGGAPRVLAEQCVQNGGTPELLWDVFQHRPILPAQAAHWLGCDQAQAEELLFVLGLDDRGDGLWAPSATEDARAMTNVLLELRDRAHYFFGERDAALTRLLYIAETGERLPLPDIDEWHRQFEAGLPPEHELVDEEDDEDEPQETEDLVLPLEQLRLDCGCDAPECSASARITLVGRDQLRFDIADGNHLVAPTGYIELIATQQRDDGL